MGTEVRTAIGVGGAALAGLLVGTGCADAVPQLGRPYDGRLVPRTIEIMLGDDAPRVPFAIVRGQDGVLDTLSAPTIHSFDTTVVRVDAGALVARRVGNADVQFSAEGRTYEGEVRVMERVHDGPVTLAPGEVRAWELSPGQFTITIAAVRPAEALRSLELAAGLRCATSSRTPDTISCRVRTPTRLVLRHTSAHAAAETAHVQIIRGPE
jgi:hypothetical protein